MLKKFVCFILIIAGFAAGNLAFAQERSYHYDSISITARVNEDATVDIEERQVFNYAGEYHNGWRVIPLNKISAITDVEVIDGATGQPVAHTVSRENGAENIKWNYNLKDTTHEWIIKYKVHGALSFLRDKDEFYWNLFTDYDVSVDYAEARVILPENNFASNQVQAYGYGSEVVSVNNQEAVFAASNIPPGGDVTIAFGWPRGLVDRSAFWQWWFRNNWLYFLSALIVVATIIYTFIRWYVLEYRPEKSRTIVPEYAPPRNLKPAEAVVIVKEGINSRVWSATIVDLAVRGYLKIEEVEKKGWLWTSKDYQLTKVKELDAAGTSDYERGLISAIFGLENPITLKRLRERNQGSATLGHKFSKEIEKVKKELYAETEAVTGAYLLSLTKNQGKWVLSIVITMLAAFLVGFAGPKILISVLALGISISIILFSRYDTRLSPEGMQLKREILGFKLYLETAERYRLENLTPDLFEKFLPYAIAFGVEKKWARAFAGIAVPPPEWYSSPAVIHTGSFSGDGVSSGFSASAFSSSFASSFASAFSSSSGGASGGGGGAGGGGGGGAS